MSILEGFVGMVFILALVGGYAGLGELFGLVMDSDYER